MSIPPKDWPHAPIHRFDSSGIYMVTGATLYKNLLFKTPEKLTLLENKLLSLAKEHRWQLEAWAVFANHYHFVGRRDEQTNSLSDFLQELHTVTAVELNNSTNVKVAMSGTTSGIQNSPLNVHTSRG